MGTVIIVAVVVLCFALSIAVGLAASWRRQDVSEDYFLAARSLPWYAVALSVAGTGLRLEFWLAMIALAAAAGMAAAAFAWGNFLAGIAGALYALMVGYIAPNNFTFGDSLILVSIVLIGGIGNLWGAVVASAIVVVLPEKFQAIQEYRFLLYAGLVILLLLFQPQGLFPRQMRAFVSGRASP